MKGSATMNRYAIAFGCMFALVPQAASAALSVRFSHDISVFVPGSIPPAEQYVDLVFNETGPNVNEGLFAYDLYITRDGPGINLLRAERPDNFVFTSPGASFQQADISTPPNTLVVNAIGDLLGANQDIRDGTKVARVYYTIDPNIPLGAHRIMLDQTPGTTLFVSGDTGEAIPVDISDTAEFLYIPEPGGLSLAGIAVAAAILRRRRSA
jgi:hypothetical protein